MCRSVVVAVEPANQNAAETESYRFWMSSGSWWGRSLERVGGCWVREVAFIYFSHPGACWGLLGDTRVQVAKVYLSLMISPRAYGTQEGHASGNRPRHLTWAQMTMRWMIVGWQWAAFH